MDTVRCVPRNKLSVFSRTPGFSGFPRIGRLMTLAIIAGAIATDTCLTLLAPQYQWIESLTARKSWPYWLTMTLFVYITLFLGQLGAEQFIYFQF